MGKASPVPNPGLWPDCTAIGHNSVKLDYEVVFTMEYFRSQAPCHFSPHNVRFVCQHPTDAKTIRLVCQHLFDLRLQKTVRQGLPASHQLQKAHLSPPHYFPPSLGAAERVACLHSFVRHHASLAGGRLCSRDILTTSPTYQVQLSGPSRGSTLQRLRPMQSVIGEEVIPCSSIAGFHLV